MSKQIIGYTQSHHTRNGRDITISFDTAPCQNRYNFMWIRSLHGENRIIEKSITLSVEETKALIAKLSQAVADFENKQP